MAKLVHEADQARLMQDYVKLYELMEGVLFSIEEMVTDIEIAIDDIRSDYELIDQRITSCLQRLKSLNESEHMKKQGFKVRYNSPVSCKPET